MISVIPGCWGVLKKRSFFLVLIGGMVCLPGLPLRAESKADVQDQVFQRESMGDLSGARSLLEEQVHGSSSDSSAAEQLAEFLDRHQDPGRRAAFLQWAGQEKDPARQRLALRQVVLLDFIAGNKSQLSSDLERYRAAGGNDLAEPSKLTKSGTYSTISIPGPLSSFARMAALTPELAPEDLLPALARNVVTNGYQAGGNESLEQTEYLRLLVRYIGQARELQSMAGSGRQIVIPSCDSQQTGDLLKILGYRMRGSCGGDLVLETVNPTRAFLTVDSGFPLTELEQDLRANHRFELPYAPASVPLLYTPAYWLAAGARPAQADFLDAFLSDPSLCRLYLGLSHLDRPTAEALRKQASPAKLKIYAHVLDFFGSMFEVRNGVAVVPGSPRAWASLVGVSPNNPGAFFERLIATDDGWMASYFDALSRMHGPSAAYLTQPERMKRFYEAVRGKITSPGPARPVFRSSTELLLLTTSLRLDANGQPHIPGDLDVWRNLFIHHPHGKYDGRLTRSAGSWRTGDDFVEALFALTRKAVENEPLKIYLALNDIDRGRVQPMSARLAARLVNGYRTYSAQYVLLADAPGLSEESIDHYLDTCASIANIREALLRSDTLGTFQSLIELWRILVIQNSIPVSSEDPSFAKLIAPFAHVRQETEVFDAGRSGLDTLLRATNLRPGVDRQDQVMELLVGKLRRSRESAVPSPSENFLRVFDAQLLIPLDTLFTAADKLNQGTADAATFKTISEQLSRLEEAQSVHSSLSTAEKSSFALGYWSGRHIEQEEKLSVDKLLKRAEKRDARDVLAPFLRDSLVGILYSYYAPPGAQVLLTNPMFVRSHDFMGPENSPSAWRETEVAGSGWPESAGGRLMGSLVTLPYAIAEAEQNFLTPKREQALIWGDLVPQMIVDVTVNRWRNVRPEQIRWVSLHIERGRMLFAASAMDPSIEASVLEQYRRYATPAEVEQVQDKLHDGNFQGAMLRVTPSVLYAVASDPALQNISPDAASSEIAGLAAQNDPDLTEVAISRCFGTPKLTLTHSYQPGLLYLRTFPALMGYSSRILAESWESNNLFFAALAEETGIPVDELDSYVPEWNRTTIENIFATHLEDWPALLRSLRTTAENVKQRGARTAAANTLEY